MKRLLAAITALFAATCYAQTAPIGVCISNVAQTISNGLIAPVPSASITLCSQNSTSTNCAANIVSIYTSTTLGTPTPTNPFVADVGGNYFFCAAVGHYALMIQGSVGGFFVPDITLADDWSKGGVVTGNWQATSFIGPLTGNAATASASDHSPTQCGAGNYAAGVSTLWAANCDPLFYQTLEFNTTSATQRPAANYSQRFTGTDSASPARTNVDLNAPGTGNFVPTETANPGASTNCAQYDGSGNIGPVSNPCNVTSATQSANLVGSRSFGSTFQNTTGKTMYVSGYGITPSGSGTSQMSCLDGPSSPTLPIGGCGQSNSTVSGGHTAFSFIVPNTYFYEVTFTGTDAGSLSVWVETTF